MRYAKNKVAINPQSNMEALKDTLKENFEQVDSKFWVKVYRAAQRYEDKYIGRPTHQIKQHHQNVEMS